MCKIEKGVNINTKRFGREAKYPFEDCKKGEGFFIPDKDTSQISGSLNHWNKKLYPANFKSSSFDSDGKKYVRDGKTGVMVMRVQ